MVNVRIVGLQLDPASGVSVVLLGETETPTRVLPILIGSLEARSIAVAVAGLAPARPGTHDLMVSMIELTDCQLAEVAITELNGGTFFAELSVEAPDGTHRISARPSDGIALAIRTDTPIRVNVEVLDAAAVPVRHESADPFSEEEIDEIVAQFHDLLATAQPSDFDLPDDDGE